MQKVPNLPNDFTAFEKDLFHLVVGHQVEVSLAVTDFGVFESVPLGRWRAQRLGKNNERHQLDRDLAGLGGEHGAADADEIAKIEVFEDLELIVAENILLRVNLDASGLISNVNKLALAHLAVSCNAARECDFLSFGIIGSRLRARLGWRKMVGERVNSFGSKRRQLRFALIDQ